jgi:hypothetical protein
MSSRPQIPAGLERFIREWCDGHRKRDPEAWAWADYQEWQRADMIASARDAYPHLLADFKERLLSDEALQAGADAICIEKPATAAERNEVRIEIEAALASLKETDGGGERG